MAPDSIGDRATDSAGAGSQLAARRYSGNDRQRPAVEPAPAGDSGRVTGASYRQPSLPGLRRLSSRGLAWRLARRNAWTAAGDRILRARGAHGARMGRRFAAAAAAGAANRWRGVTDTVVTRSATRCDA